jgi:hypothetical protein
MSLGERLIRRLAPELCAKIDLLIAIHRTVLAQMEAQRNG